MQFVVAPALKRLHWLETHTEVDKETYLAMKQVIKEVSLKVQVCRKTHSQRKKIFKKRYKKSNLIFIHKNKIDPYLYKNHFLRNHPCYSFDVQFIIYFYDLIAIIYSLNKNKKERNPYYFKTYVLLYMLCQLT